MRGLANALFDAISSQTSGKINGGMAEIVVRIIGYSLERNGEECWALRMGVEWRNARIDDACLASAVKYR